MPRPIASKPPLTRAPRRSPRTPARPPRLDALLRAVTYCRISHDPDGREAGVDRQRDDTDALARREGMTVLERLVDNDRSASRYATRDREGWARLMELIEDGAIDAVIVYDLDRLVRQPKELERLIDAADHGVTVLTAKGTIDLSTGGGRMVARTFCNVAAHEADRVSERQRDKLRHDAMNGRQHWARRPFGYTMAGDIEPSEAAWIRKMAAWYLDDGLTMNAIAIRLNAEGVRTTQGNLWQYINVRKVLTAPRTAGLREYHGEIVGEASWPAILDRPRWEQILTALEMRGSRPRKRRGGKTALLTRLLRCTRCGAAYRPMTRTTTKDGYAWRCMPRPDGGCSLQVAAAPVEALVAEAVIARLGNVTTERRQRSERPDNLDALDQQLEQAAALWGDGTLSTREYLAAKDGIEIRRQAALSAQVAADHADATAKMRRHPGGIEAAWQDMSIEARRRILAAVIDYIEILPATERYRFDPSRVVIHWRA